MLKLIAITFFENEVYKFKQDLKSVYCKFNDSEHEIPSAAIELLIAAEDHRFYQHCGVDFISVTRAILQTYLYKNIQGGSTIEQQLVRTITGNNQKTLKRKIYEIFLAVCVTDVIDKSDVPLVYLKIAYFGYNMTGYQQAINKSQINPAKINPYDLAKIISQLKYPRSSAPSEAWDNKINTRVSHILKKYYELGYKLVSN